MARFRHLHPAVVNFLRVVDEVVGAVPGALNEGEEQLQARRRFSVHLQARGKLASRLSGR